MGAPTAGVESACPQIRQKLAPSVIGDPHLLQYMLVSSAANGVPQKVFPSRARVKCKRWVRCEFEAITKCAKVAARQNLYRRTVQAVLQSVTIQRESPCRLMAWMEVRDGAFLFLLRHADG